MRVYISGPITGVEDYREKFKTAEEKMRAAGYEVINPAELGEVFPDLKYEEYVKLDFALIDMCDAILILEGWEHSKGTDREYHYAKAKGMKVMFNELNNRTGM